MKFKLGNSMTEQKYTACVAKLLQKNHADLELELVNFSAEHFVSEANEALIANEIDFVVQELSAVPEELADGLTLAAMLPFNDEVLAVICRMSDELIFALLREIADEATERKVLAERYFK